VGRANKQFSTGLLHCTSLTDFVNIILTDQTPEAFRPALFRASFTLLVTALSKKCSEQAVTLLAPRQLGFGVPGGIEAAAHATRRYVDSLPAGHVYVDRFR
jgi:hypothetical protein